MNSVGVRVATVHCMIKKHMPKVLALQDLPDWNEESLTVALRQRDVIAKVAVDATNEIIAAMLYRLCKSQINIVDMWGANCGVAALLARCVDCLRGDRRQKITFVVSETNDDYLSLLRSNGFKATGLLRGYFGRRDGIVMEINKKSLWQA